MNIFVERNINPINFTDGINPKRLVNLKGNVKKLTQFCFDLNGDSSDKKFINSTDCYSLFFANDKRLKTEYSYRNENFISSKTHYLDFRNNKSSFTEYYDELGENIADEGNYYDKFGMLVKQINRRGLQTNSKFYPLIRMNEHYIRKGLWGNAYYCDQLLTKFVLNNNNLTKKYNYYHSNRLKSILDYEEERLIRCEEFNDLGFLSKLKVNEYKNNKLQAFSEYRHLYNEINLKTESQERYLRKGQIQSQTFKYVYNDKLNLEYVMRNRGERDVLISELRYNKFGDLVYKKYEKDVNAFEYLDYDNNGNWLRRIQFYKQKPIIKFERKIEYFEI